MILSSSSSRPTTPQHHQAANQDKEVRPPHKPVCLSPTAWASLALNSALLVTSYPIPLWVGCWSAARHTGARPLWRRRRRVPNRASELWYGRFISVWPGTARRALRADGWVSVGGGYSWSKWRCVWVEDEVVSFSQPGFKRVYGGYFDLLP